MTRRYWTVMLLLAATAGGCGDNTSSPIAPSTTPPAVLVLSPGPYTMTFSVSASQPPGPSGGTLCAFNTLPAASAAFPVTVSGSGDSYAVKPEGGADLGFSATLQRLGNAYRGFASGRALDPSTGVEVTVTPLESPPGFSASIDVLSAGFGDATGVRGVVAATVSFARGNTRRQCTLNEWKLERR